MFHSRNEKIKYPVYMVLLFIISALFFAGCSLDQLVRTTYDSSSSLTLRDVEIDEKEVESIRTASTELQNDYDISQGISTIADQLENPFEPFYYEEQTDEIKNIFILENIYFENDLEYCEIKINDYTYVLAETDTFLDNYMVQSINESSVIILKGDEILTLFIGEMIQG